MMASPLPAPVDAKADLQRPLIKVEATNLREDRSPIADEGQVYVPPPASDTRPSGARSWRPIGWTTRERSSCPRLAMLVSVQVAQL